MKAFLDTSGQLKLQQRQVERDLHRSFFSNHVIPASDLGDLEDFQRELDMSRGQVQKEMFKDINRVKGHISQVTETFSAFVQQTNEHGPGENYDYVLGEVRKTIDCVEGELQEFKEGSRRDYDQLALEGKELEEEMGHMMERFETWKNAPAIQSIPVVSEHIPGRLKPPTSHFQQEISSLDQQMVDLGGKNLGWEDADSAEFLKTYTKHKGKLTPGFLHDAQNVLPYYSQADIRSHFEKHRQFLDLQDKKKDLVAKWKAEKEKLKVERTKPTEEPTQSHPRSQSAQSNRNTKQQLEDWHKRRAEQQALEAKEKAAAEALQRKTRVSQGPETEKKRQLVAEYKERKQIAEEQKQLIADYERRRNQVELTDQDKARLREREEIATHQRSVQVLTKKQREEMKKQRALELQLRTRLAWAHVESKLEEETTASLKRKEAKGRENRAETFGGMLVRTTGRAIPTWRAGLNQ